MLLKKWALKLLIICLELKKKEPQRKPFEHYGSKNDIKIVCKNTFCWWIFGLSRESN